MMKHAVVDAFQEESPDPDGPSCQFCHVTLRTLAATFKGMRHSGSALKKRKLNPPKTRRSIDAYRDVSAQNAWLLSTVFDDKGNYNYCNDCIVHYLSVGKQRLARLSQIKIEKNQKPVIEMTKQDVLEKKLVSLVSMPLSAVSSFAQWWKSLSGNTPVQVQNPIGRHGLSGKRSNNAKEEVKVEFLSFVDLHSQPNGRQAGSYGPHFYFDSTFTRFDVPKRSCKNYDEMCRRSVVATFNLAQVKCGKGTCSSASAATWLKECRPKHGVSPQKLDYCDTCIEYKEQAKRFRQIANRLLESGNAAEEEVESNYALARSYDELLKEHKEIA